MYKILITATLILLCSTTHAANLNKYAEALDWESKWEKLISRQTNKYVDNIKRSKLSQLSAEKQKEVASQLTNKISESLSWANVGNRFMRNYADSCGTDLLDKFVDVKSGVEFSGENRKQILMAHEKCSKSALEKSMTMIHKAFNKLPKTADERFSKTVGDILIIRKKALKSFRQKYLTASGHKAFAQSESGNWNWRSNRTSEEHAINNALASCRARNLKFENWQPCKIINLNEKWTDVYHQLFTRVAKSEADIMSKKALKTFQQEYLKVKRDKAFAQSANGAWSWRSSKVSVSDAINNALAACQKTNKNHEQNFPCKIINVNNKWRGG